MLTTYRLGTITYKIGMQLICTSFRTEHGLKDHILEIASFDRNSKTHIWCHGISGLTYPDVDLIDLRLKYPEGNFGLTPKLISNYAIYNNEWDI